MHNLSRRSRIVMANICRFSGHPLGPKHWPFCSQKEFREPNCQNREFIDSGGGSHPYYGTQNCHFPIAPFLLHCGPPRPNLCTKLNNKLCSVVVAKKRSKDSDLPAADSVTQRDGPLRYCVVCLCTETVGRQAKVAHSTSEQVMTSSAVLMRIQEGGHHHDGQLVRTMTSGSRCNKVGEFRNPPNPPTHFKSSSPTTTLESSDGSRVSSCLQLFCGRLNGAENWCWLRCVFP